MPHPPLEDVLGHRPLSMAVVATALHLSRSPQQLQQLRAGEILLDYHILSTRRAQVQVELYVQQPRHRIWQQVTQYNNWPQLLPNILKSDRLPAVVDDANPSPIRLRQAAGFEAGVVCPQVEIILTVEEFENHTIQFQLERGSFSAFDAQLSMCPCEWGTFLRYEVAAELYWPMPRLVIEQGIRHILPRNLKALRERLSNL